MLVLVIGSGGREHALAWQIAQTDSVDKVYVAPGNAGTALEPKLENLSIAADDYNTLLDFAKTKMIELTIVGPEQPLVDGLVDRFEAAGLACFGPSQRAAQLEGSKAFTKDFLARHDIPTAAYANFTNSEQAKEYVRSQKLPIVIKADGLAAGKGVIIASSLKVADATIDDMLAGNRFGEAGHRVVIEEFLVGEEASFIVMVDGEHILPLATSQDHKARDNADKGPNTGGMGAYSPAPVVTDEVFSKAMQQVIEPTVKGMAAEGNPYVGFLYAGLMVDENNDIKVLEYNCRFGDPETQPIMMRLMTPLSELCLTALNGNLDQITVSWKQQAAVGIVMAAGGYPDSYAKGKLISLPYDISDNCKVFHAGTELDDIGNVITAGGRVLCVVALADSVSAAQSKAYQLVNKIHWDDVYFRTDIAYRAIEREQKAR